MENLIPSPNLEAARESIRAVLLQPEPFQNLHALAKQLRDSGMPQSVMSGLFTEFLLKHREDQNESRNDAICDTLDFIVGWCSEGNRLFPATE
jgi:hypothetical protein